MNDNKLQELLQQADERIGRAAAPVSNQGDTAFVEVVYQRRARQLRRRRSVGVWAVLAVVGGLSAWSLSAGLWTGTQHDPDTIASEAGVQPIETQLIPTTDGPAATTEGGARRRLQPDEIKRIRGEIAALDAEAERARRLVDLYRAAEVRRQRLALLEAAPAGPVLPTDILADLEIDRAAAITVTSADTQANHFNQLDKAVESYRSVLTHFPSSHWASIARQRLAGIQHMN